MAADKSFPVAHSADTKQPPGFLRREQTRSSLAAKTGRASGTNRYYRPELDVLRFLAFFLVFNHHLLPGSFLDTHFQLVHTLQEAGASGVCLFFTLSSFLITELLLREQESTGTIHIRAFYVRRVLRIWPLYFAVLAAAAILPHLVHRYSSPAGFLVPYLLLCGNWAVVLQGFPHNPILSPLWSISVEEQFYLLWPTLISRLRHRGILLAAALVLPLAWATDFLLPALHYAKDPTLWCNGISQFQFFALGGVLALLTHRRGWQLSAGLRLLCAAGGFWLLLLTAFPFHFLDPAPTFKNGQVLAGYLCIDAGCVLLLCAFLNTRMPPWTKPFIYLGKISYGLYVFHYVLRVMVGAAVERKLHLAFVPGVALTYTVTLALTIGLASLSYRFLEKPFLRLKDRFAFVPSRPA